MRRLDQPTRPSSIVRRPSSITEGTALSARKKRWVVRDPAPADPRGAIAGKRIAVPGLLTTAFLTLKLYQPDFVPIITPFDHIEARTLSGEVDAGLLIHEGQLTYADRGLHLWADMGEWWYRETGLPLPLGGNVVRRDFGPDLIRAIAAEYALSRASLSPGEKYRIWIASKNAFSFGSFALARRPAGVGSSLSSACFAFSTSCWAQSGWLWLIASPQ